MTRVTGEGELPKPALTAVTLESAMAASARFYEVVGFTRKFPGHGRRRVLEAGGVALVVWISATRRRRDGEDEPRPTTFRARPSPGNCATPEEVDTALDKALAAACCRARPDRLRRLSRLSLRSRRALLGGGAGAGTQSH